MTLRQVAQDADASNTGPGNLIGDAWGPQQMCRKHEVLRSHCEKICRPPESSLRTHVNFMMKLGKDESASVVRDRAEAFDFDFDRFTGTPEDAVAYYRALVGVGVRYFITSVADAETLRLLAEEVVPEVVRPKFYEVRCSNLRAPPRRGGRTSLEGYQPWVSPRRTSPQTERGNVARCCDLLH